MNGTRLSMLYWVSRTRCSLPGLHELARGSRGVLRSGHGADDEEAIDTRLAQGGQVARLDAAADDDRHGADGMELREFLETARDDVSRSIAAAVGLRRRLVQRAGAKVVDVPCIGLTDVVEQLLRARRQPDDCLSSQELAADRDGDIALADVDACLLYTSPSPRDS